MTDKFENWWRAYALSPRQLAIAFAWLVAALGWGSAWYLNRVTFSSGGFTNYAAAAIRFDIAAFIALLACVATGRTRSFNKRMFWLNCLAAVPMSIFYLGIYMATTHILGGLAATINSLSGVVMICLSVLLGMEKVPKSAWLGALLSVFGTGVIFLNKASFSSPHGIAAQGTAVLVMAGAAASYAVSTVILRQRKSDDPFAATSTLLAAEGILLTLMAEWIQPGEVIPPIDQLQFQPVAALLTQVVFSTLGAFGAYVYLSTRVTMPTMASLPFATPLVAITIDRIYEKPELWVVNYTWTTFAGAALILTGLVPVVWKKKTA